MQLKQNTEYFIRIMLYLARKGKHAVVPGNEIAANTCITPLYLKKMTASLRQHGLIASEQGPLGGFYLERAPEEILLYDIVLAGEGMVEFNRCGGLAAPGSGDVSRSDRLQRHLLELQALVEAHLKAVDLAELL